MYRFSDLSCSPKLSSDRYLKLYSARHTTMKLLRTATLVALAATQAIAASQWGFADATVSVSAKGAGVGSGLKEK